MTLRRQLAIVMIAGGAIRLALAAYGGHHSFETYDMDSARIVWTALHVNGWHIYDTGRWPYPGGLLPWLLFAGALHGHVGLSLAFWFKLAPIVCDLGIAWLVQDHLGRRGATDRLRLAAAGLVCLGPTFFAVSGSEGQVDSVCMLPAIGALWIWDRTPVGRRDILVGVLLGLGAAVKIVPLLMLLAFVPLLENWLARLRMTAIACAIPAITIVPFVLADSNTLSEITGYSGLPGLGGFGMLVQPSITKLVITGHGTFVWTATTKAIQDHFKPVLAAALVLVAAVIARRRPRPEIGASLIWLTVYVFLPNFFMQYAVWGLATFLMAGRVREVALVQALLLVPLVLTWGYPWRGGFTFWLYIVPMTALLLVAAGALMAAFRQLWREPVRQIP